MNTASVPLTMVGQIVREAIHNDARTMCACDGGMRDLSFIESRLRFSSLDTGGEKTR